MNLRCFQVIRDDFRLKLAFRQEKYQSWVTSNPYIFWYPIVSNEIFLASGAESQGLQFETKMSFGAAWGQKLWQIYDRITELRSKS